MFKDPIKVNCPQGHEVETDLTFAIDNGRIYCGDCCKAFDVVVSRPSMPSKLEKINHILPSPLVKEDVVLEEDIIDEDPFQHWDVPF